ncbi:helix-turn-helix domain-containing protein [uncultured Anaerofustis sp.]|uniref:helix-turn-helix domain-containing protein n=1 Tax=uncultured Anaerofustis sp. TaxID=904996 RepID=UPI0025D5ADE7|nr:helix-turn-helix domain-containing protein [uncultured Anaerofustis sp.]
MKKISNTSERLNYILNLRNLKQADLVRKTNLQKSAISQYLSGKVEPKQDNIFILANALSVSEAWLMGYDVPMYKDISNDNFNISNEEKILINKYRQLSEQQQFKVMGYIDSELHHAETAKESTPVYKIDNNTHSKVAEEQNIYNINKPKKTIKRPLVADTGDNGYVDMDLDYLEKLDAESIEEMNREYEYKKKTKELLKEFNLDNPDEDK